MNQTNSACACCAHYFNGQCGSVNKCYGAMGMNAKIGEIINMNITDYYNNLSDKEKAELRELMNKENEENEKLTFIWELGFNLEEGFFAFHKINKEKDNIPKSGEVYELEGSIFADFWTETCEDKKMVAQKGVEMIKEYVMKKIQRFAEKIGE